MGYKAYAEYKEARLEWLGNLPKHWDCLRLRLLSKRYSGGTPDKKNELYWQDGTIPWLNSGAVNQGVITQPSSFISELGLKDSSARWVPTGAVVIALAGQGKTKGTVAITGITTTCNQSMAAIIFESDHPKYMYWWLNSQYKNIRGMASDDGRDGLNLEMLGSIPCPRPSLDEQLRISHFLDCKTAQIDRLIEKTQELIEKLQEQRTAIISLAVTRGFDSNSPMKESGVKWFKEIPSSWSVHRLKMLASEPLKYGANEAADLEDPDLPRFIRITDINSDGSLNLETFKSLPEKTAAPYLLEDGDILLTRSGATVGKSFIYSPEWGQAAYAGYLIRLRTDKNILNKRFAYYFFQSSPYWANIESELIQATIQNFSAEKYSAISIPTPNRNDQDAIAHLLDHETTLIDRLIEKKHELIEKLQEHRTALITAAVTGQIDVRDWQTTAAAEEPEPDKDVA